MVGNYAYSVVNVDSSAGTRTHLAVFLQVLSGKGLGVAPLLFAGRATIHRQIGAL
jgi:hypothetical protein